MTNFQYFPERGRWDSSGVAGGGGGFLVTDKDGLVTTGCLIKHDTLLKLNSINTIHQNLISS
jgi:hypothetical protein